MKLIPKSEFQLDLNALNQNEKKSYLEKEMSSQLIGFLDELDLRLGDIKIIRKIYGGPFSRSTRIPKTESEFDKRIESHNLSLSKELRSKILPAKGVEDKFGLLIENVKFLQKRYKEELGRFYSGVENVFDRLNNLDTNEIDQILLLEPYSGEGYNYPFVFSLFTKELIYLESNLSHFLSRKQKNQLKSINDDSLHQKLKALLNFDIEEIKKESADRSYKDELQLWNHNLKKVQRELEKWEYLSKAVINLDEGSNAITTYEEPYEKKYLQIVKQFIIRLRGEYESSIQNARKREDYLLEFIYPEKIHNEVKANHCCLFFTLIEKNRNDKYNFSKESVREKFLDLINGRRSFYSHDSVGNFFYPALINHVKELSPKYNTINKYWNESYFSLHDNYYYDDNEDSQSDRLKYYNKIARKMERLLEFYEAKLKNMPKDDRKTKRAILRKTTKDIKSIRIDNYNFIKNLFF